MDLDLSKRELLEWELWASVHDSREPHQHWMYRVLCYYLPQYKRRAKVSEDRDAIINELESR